MPPVGKRRTRQGKVLACRPTRKRGPRREGAQVHTWATCGPLAPGGCSDLMRQRLAQRLRRQGAGWGEAGQRVEPRPSVEASTRGRSTSATASAVVVGPSTGPKPSLGADLRMSPARPPSTASRRAPPRGYKGMRGRSVADRPTRRPLRPPPTQVHNPGGSLGDLRCDPLNTQVKPACLLCLDLLPSMWELWRGSLH